MKRPPLGSAALMILFLVVSCAPPAGDPPPSGECVAECEDCWVYDPLMHHTNPPIVLGKGNSPPSWHRKRRGPDKLHERDNAVKVFTAEGTCQANLKVLNYGLLGKGTSSLVALRSDNQEVIKTWLDKPFQITGGGYTLTMGFSDRRANEFTLSNGRNTCILEAFNTNWRSHEKVPSEFGDLDGATIVYDPDGVNWPIETIEISTHED